MSTRPPDALYQEFGQLVRLHRERQNGVTQEDLGKRIGLSRTSVVNIEKGRQHVALHQVYAIADALRVRPEVLLPSIGGDASNSWVAESLPPETDPALRAWVGKITR